MWTVDKVIWSTVYEQYILNTTNAFDQVENHFYSTLRKEGLRWKYHILTNKNLKTLILISKHSMNDTYLE